MKKVKHTKSSTKTLRINEKTKVCSLLSKGGKLPSRLFYFTDNIFDIIQQLDPNRAYTVMIRLVFGLVYHLWKISVNVYPIVSFN